MAGAKYGVCFPMPQLASGFHGGRARGDRAFARQAAAALVGPVPLAPLLPGAAQVRVEVATAPPILPDVAIDGLVTHRQDAVAPQSPSHLLRTPIVPHQGLHPLPVGDGEASVASGAGAPDNGVRLRLLGAVPAVMGVTVAVQLAANGAPVSSEDLGDRSGRAPLPSQQAQGVPFSGGDLVVAHGRIPCLGGQRSLLAVRSPLPLPSIVALSI